MCSPETGHNVKSGNLGGRRFDRVCYLACLLHCTSVAANPSNVQIDAVLNHRGHQGFLNANSQDTRGVELAAQESGDARGVERKFWGRRKKLTLSSSESSDDGEGVRNRDRSFSNGGVAQDNGGAGFAAGIVGRQDTGAGMSTFLGEGAFEMIEELTLSRAENESLKKEIHRLEKCVEDESARAEALHAKALDSISQVFF